ncbi:ABC transporter permease [Bradyrhizobium sp. dw_78]|uniref:ABC transporter permease n=1 Tax=Bradyrhizobium sp. dw_78 TaxID=2719793 RepID=UPI001BD480AF|nr:ABC transporter permease [Bradyrhizobium sp. dw_78]
MARITRVLSATAVILGFFGAWELLCRLLHVSDLVLPLPSQILVTLIERFPDLWPHLIQTIASTLAGFTFGVLAGVVIGVMVGSSRLAYDTLYPLLIGFSSVPKVAIIPIFVIWFGAGTIPAILTALSLSIFPVVVNVATGISTSEPELEDVLRALGASRRDILWNVALPRTLPYLFASLKVAITVAFIGSITSETIASNYGIGTVMMVASANFDVALLFAGLALISITGIALYGLFSFAEARFTGWATRKSAVA